jgi:hypothetical protein
MPEDGPTEGESSTGRVFQDAAGRRWRASFLMADGEGVLQFTCMGESREPVRAMAVATGFSFTGVSDESLRGWLAGAPGLGRLTE